MKRHIVSKQEKAKKRKRSIIVVVLALLSSTGAFLINGSPLVSIIIFLSVIIVLFLFFYFKDSLERTARIKQIETVFPDFLQLMSSNLRAGMTIDRAMLLSSRPEFAPLDKEILQTGKDITTGKSIEQSLLDMSKRIDSPNLHKVLLLIISGIRAGGNLAILLDETSSNLKGRGFLEKKAASSVLMYVIFIFLAVAIFAPALFSLSTVLVEILTKIFSSIPEATTANASNLPFSFNSINISVTFIKYFALTFMIAIDILAALVLGLVSKGEEKQGLRYLPAIIGLSVSIFFLARIILGSFLSGFF